jgi:hypothetical protein
MLSKRKQVGSHRRPPSGPGPRQPSKRQRLTFDKDDMEWLKDELRNINFQIGAIRTSLIEVAEHLQGDVDLKLEEIVDRIGQL